MNEDKKVGRPSKQEQDLDFIGKLQDWWNMGKQSYRRVFEKIRILDQTDRGNLWQAIGAKYPPYQILPDTNFVAYVKNNILASIYTVTKSAEVLATSDKDKDLCANINVALDCLWDQQGVGFYQFQAGERAALCNVGYTQVGWNERVVLGSNEDIVKGQVEFKNIAPTKFMRDPHAVDLDSADWCCTFESYHKFVFLKNPLYKKEFKEYMIKNPDVGNVLADIEPGPDKITNSGAKDYYTLTIWWVRNDSGHIDEIHTVNNSWVLYRKDNIKPNMFPIVPLYCNLPAEALIGTSEPSKIFANNIAANMMDSLALTAEYKNQHPPRFVSDQSKLNVRAFAKHGGEADKTFVVNGDASKAIHYHEFPAVSPILPQLKNGLEFGIQNVSGIDGRYTGRDTGSIITTGGTEEMLNRVTLIDTPKIILYEDYCKNLTKLVLGNLIAFCPKRKFFRPKPGKPSEYETIEVDFPKIKSDTLFNYRIAISSDLPKNKQRIAAMATELLEAQEQYRKDGDNVDWITPEEWLEMQDLPFKERMLERMGIQRRENALQEVAQVLYQFAGLVQNGLTEDEAMDLTAESLLQSRAGNGPDLGQIGANPEMQQMATAPAAPAAPVSMPTGTPMGVPSMPV